VSGRIDEARAFFEAAERLIDRALLQRGEDRVDEIDERELETLTEVASDQQQGARLARDLCAFRCVLHA
jgi:hypothetical protein